MKKNCILRLFYSIHLIVVDEDTRVALLKSPGVDGSDYINASGVDVSAHMTHHYSFMILFTAIIFCIINFLYNLIMSAINSTENLKSY